MKINNDDLKVIKGEFFSPFNIVVTIGLIGIGISMGRNIVSKFTHKIFLAR